MTMKPRLLRCLVLFRARLRYARLKCPFSVQGNPTSLQAFSFSGPTSGGMPTTSWIAEKPCLARRAARPSKSFSGNLLESPNHHVSAKKPAILPSSRLTLLSFFLSGHLPQSCKDMSGTSLLAESTENARASRPPPAISAHSAVKKNHDAN